jgi:hypothetical protein
MDKEVLQNRLDALHAELDRAEALDDDRREALRQSAKAIQARLEQAEKDPDDESLLDRLNEAVVQFEGTHPTLALAITQVINALVDIGV